MKSIPLRLVVQHVQDTHMDGAGTVQRSATLTAAQPDYGDGTKPPKDPNAVLGDPMRPQISFTLHIGDPELQPLFMKGRIFDVTLKSRD